MSTNLELCQDMARDIGIPGTGPSTVESTTGLSEEEIAVIRYIQQADLDIQSRWLDWNYLWQTATLTTVTSTATLSLATNTANGFPTDVGNWKVGAVVWDPTSESYQPLEYEPWNEYRDNYKYGTVDSDIPEVFSIHPSANTLDFYPTPSSNTKISAEYWQTPTELTTNAQISAIPPRFHRIIIARAKMYYAENEDAPEIMAGSLAEFEDLLDKLEADQLQRQKNRRMSSAQDPFNFVVRTE